MNQSCSTIVNGIFEVTRETGVILCPITTMGLFWESILIKKISSCILLNMLKDNLATFLNYLEFSFTRVFFKKSKLLSPCPVQMQL